MFLYIYTRPLWVIWLAIIVPLAAWCAVNVLLRRYSRLRRFWTPANALILLVSLGGIVYGTIIRRAPSNREVFLQPFHCLEAAKLQPEIYREMLMNTFLFFPLGLALSAVLPHRLSTAARVILTVVLGFLLSICIEYLQYRFSLGIAETDDVIFNTLGSLIGAVHLVFAEIIVKFRRKT